METPTQIPNYPQSGVNPAPAYPPVQKSSSGCGCFMGCLMGCFGFIVLCIGGLAFLYYTVDFKGMFTNKMTNPNTVAWVYKMAKQFDMVDKFLPEHLSDGEKLKIKDELDKVMACYPLLSDNDRKLIFELSKTENNQNLNVEQIQSLLNSIQAKCGLSYEQLQQMQKSLK